MVEIRRYFFILGILLQLFAEYFNGLDKSPKVSYTCHYNSVGFPIWVEVGWVRWDRVNGKGAFE